MPEWIVVLLQQQAALQSTPSLVMLHGVLDSWLEDLVAGIKLWILQVLLKMGWEIMVCVLIFGLEMEDKRQMRLPGIDSHELTWLWNEGG